MDGLICLRALWDRIAAGAFILGGAALVVDAGLHARDAVFAAHSFSFLTSGGLGGLAALAFGCTLLVSAGFHDEWRKLDRIERAMSARAANGRGPAPVAVPDAGVTRWVRAEADRVAGWALIAVGAVWLAVGARLVSSALYTPDQVAYVISGGFGAMVTLGTGLALLLAADTRDEEHKLARIGAALGDRVPLDDDPEGARSGRRGLVAGAAGLALGVVVMVAGWWQAADALRVDRALEGLVVAALGVGVVGAVLTVAVLRRRRRLARRARAVLARVVPSVALVQPVEAYSNGANGTRWTAAGLHHFHVAACPALAGIVPEERTAVRLGSGLEPCLLCEADAGVTADA